MSIDPVSLAITAALTAANMAITASRTIEGPRLDDLSATVGDYGAPVPRIWGKRRVQPPVFWAEDLREVKRRRKTKGGKFNEYTYYGSWAVALTDREIEGVTRIWFDAHLVLDLTGAGPVTPFELGYEGNGGKGGLGVLGGVAGVVIGNQGAIDAEAFVMGESFALYKGTMTQEPDPRMAASVEAINGAGTCPAYRGIAYVVFKDVPLEKIGNRIPQVSVEVIGAADGGADWPTEVLTLAYQTSRFHFSPDYTFIATGQASGATLLDTAARAAISSFAFDPALTDQDFALEEAGTILGLTTGAGGYVYRYAIGGAGTAYVDVNSSTAIWSAVDAEGTQHWATRPLFDGADLYFDGVATSLFDATGISWNPGQMFCDADGGTWVVGGKDPGFGSDTAYFFRLAGAGTGPDFIAVSGLATAENSNGAVHYRDATRDQFVFEWDGDLVIYDRLTAAVTATLSGYSPATETFEALRPGARSIWKGLTEISLADLSVIRTLTIGQWGLGSAPSQTVYDPINHALISRSAFTIRWLYLDRLAGATVTLGTIAADIAASVGVEDSDFSALDQAVQGWSATQGSASAMLEPLLDAFDSDVLPHEFGIIGKKRGGAAGATLATAMFAGSPRYTVRVRQSAELPLALTYQFADVNADQQPNNVRVDRPADAVSGRDERTIDLGTFASDADTMRGLAERHFRRIWGERREAELALTLRELALEPGDVRLLELDGETMRARCVRTTIAANGTIGTAWRYDHASFAALSGAAGAEMDGRPAESIVVPLISKGFFLDIPYLRDADARTPPSLYFMAAPYADGGWPGATAYEATGGEYTEEIGAVASGSAASWGYTADVLPEVNPNVWDRGSSIEVVLQTGSLTGCTEADCDADETRNQMLIGQEIVQFTTATLTAPLTYTVSGFKRGRRGTEWACGAHVAGEEVKLLATAQIADQGLSEVGTNLSFKAITSGRTTGFPVDLAPFSGASLKPWAPCHLTATQSGSDWVLSGTRRTRIGGAWTGGSTIPLSEASEEYEIEVMDGATVKRTFTLADITETGSGFTVTYTAAQQTTDFGAPLGSAPVWRAYQISDAVGRGFMAEAA